MLGLQTIVEIDHHSGKKEELKNTINPFREKSYREMKKHAATN